MAQFIQLPSLSLSSCCFCIFIFILFALHFWALAKICIFNSPLSLSHPLHSLSRSERVSYLSLHSSCCYYMHCVLKLNSGLIVMNVRLCLQVLLMDLLRVATAHTILYIHSFISAFKFSEGKGKQCWVSNLKLAWLNCLAQSQLSLELRLFGLMAL